MFQQRGDDDGFTLIELLVVVIIIGILAAIAIPAYLNERDSAWASEAQSQLHALVLAGTSYEAEHDAYPTDFTKLAKYGYTADDDVDVWFGASGSTYIVYAQSCNGGDRSQYVLGGNAGVVQAARNTGRPAC